VSELLESANKHSSLIAKIIISTGVLITWSYCAFLINFFPTGLSIADSLIFVFIALGFGALYFSWLAIGFAAVYYGYLIVKTKGTLERFYFAVVCVILCAFSIAIGYRVGGPTGAPMSLASGVLFYFAVIQLKLENEKDPDARRRQARLRTWLIFAAIFGVPAIALPVIGKITDKSFSLIGIQQKDVSLALSSENQKIVSDVAKEFGISIYGCLKNDNQSNIAHHFNVLWHGLGERSLVQITAYENDKWVPKARVELDRSGLKVLSATDKKNSFNTCLTVNTDTLFDIYEDKISDNGKLQLAKFTQETKHKLEADNLQILSATITGHTDRIPVFKTGDSNMALSMRRADSVYAEIKDLFAGLSDSQTKRLAQGSLVPKSNCPRDLAPSEQKECLAVDRRVEIELKVQIKDRKN
jgi:outer membrane protein OmpA-like peptidoglycan-associated protein/putative Mn2+ efflux pump MntP